MSECPIPCNLCGASDVEVIATHDRDRRRLRTTICRLCGLVWTNPRPSAEEVRLYYSREYRLAYKGYSTPSLRHVARSGRGALDRYRVLTPYLKPGNRILDVGAGAGEVVYVLRQRGFEAVGLEPDQRYAQHAREALGVPVSTGYVQDVTFPTCRFDVVTMYHALEHVEDPVAILSRLRSWMVDNGVLVIEVPNIESTCISPGHQFHFAHLYHFSRATLEASGRKSGFQPVLTATSPDGGNLIGVFTVAETTLPVHTDPENYSRVARVLRGHTALTFYRSRFPYVGPLDRLTTYLADSWVARGCSSPKEVLDKLIEGNRGPT